MDHRLKYFLLAAEEMNMRKAAEKAFISPQGMSAAILSENNLDFCEKITLGILESRYEIAIPDIASAFIKQYPHVKLDVVSGYRRYPPNLTSIPLLDDKFALLITQNMLEKYFDGITKAEIDTMKKGIELKDFAHVPLIQYPNYTKFYHALSHSRFV